MKTAFTIILSFLFIIIKNNNYHKTPDSNYNNADSILQKTFSRLNILKNISYNIKRELNFSSENSHNIMNWNVYFDFQSTDKIIGFKYQIEDEKFKQFFNGTEEFTINKKVKTIEINDHPNQKTFSNNSALYNSIITLKYVLPIIIADKTITKTSGDTTINNTSYYLTTLYLNKKRIQNLGTGFDAMTTKSNFIYKIIIDKKNDLPFEVLQVNDANSDFIKTSFTNISIDKSLGSEAQWFYSTYTNEYKQFVQNKLPQLISVGADAPDWVLQLYNKEEKIALSDLKGKVIMLDFWIKNCGPCIESITYLNALKEKFKYKKFEILGINSYDAKADISSFCNNHKPNYKVLMQGKAIAAKYGVSVFPTVILIDKEGKVLFSELGFEKSAVEKVIEKNL